MTEPNDMMLKISEIALEQLKDKVIELVADYNRGLVSDDDFYFTMGELGKDIADIYAYRNSSMDAVKMMDSVKK